MPPSHADMGSGTARIQNIVMDVLSPGTVYEIPINLPEDVPPIEQVVEIAPSDVQTARLVWQYEPQTQHCGTLLVMTQRRVEHGSQKRTIQIRFGSQDLGRQRVSQSRETDPITVGSCEFDEDQEAFEIRTPSARYLYHKVGGGFSSLVDRDGNDWLGYRPGGGPAGAYRGLPNMAYRPKGDRNNHFHPGHAGRRASTARLIQAGPIKATIESSVDEYRWRVRWDIYPQFARMTVLNVDRDDPRYWFLYEGTPGGRFDAADRCLRAPGYDSALSVEWEDQTSEANWAAFRVPEQSRSLILSLETETNVSVSYRPMEPMTVFGFGRRLGSVKGLLSTAPMQFTVRLVETADPNELATLATNRELDPVSAGYT